MSTAERKTLETILSNVLVKLNLTKEDIFEPRYFEGSDSKDGVVYATLKGITKEGNNISFGAYSNGNISFKSYNTHNQKSVNQSAVGILAKIAKLETEIEQDTVDTIS